MSKHYYKPQELQLDRVTFSLGSQRDGKPLVKMHYNGVQDVAMVSPPALTQWPRATGEGNYGSMFGPSDPMKTKYTLDLNDTQINGCENKGFYDFKQIMDQLDSKLLKFVTDNQLKLLGRKNLTEKEVEMLQIKSVRPRYDKLTGALNGHSINLSTPKYVWDGMGGKYARSITVCDHTGQAIPNGQVTPGDIVSATLYANQVYTGVGGDKFGIHWSFTDVSVVCQRASLEMKTEVSAFKSLADCEYAKPYVDTSKDTMMYDAADQFNA